MPFRADDVFDELTVGTSPVGEIHIFDDTVGSPPGPVIEFTDAGGERWVIDAFEDVVDPTHHVLNISRAAAGFIAPPKVQLRYDASTGLTNVFLIAGHIGTNSSVDTLMQGPVIDIAPNTSLQLQSPSIILGPGAVTATASINMAGVAVSMRGDQLDAEVWQDVATAPGFQNGWGNLGGVQPPAQYRRRGSVVDVRGVVTGGTINLPVFTLPAAYRPTYNHVYPVIISGGGTGQIAVIAATGQVNPVNGSTVAMALNGVVPLG